MIVAHEPFNSSDAVEIRIHFKAYERVYKPNIYIKVLQQSGATSCMIRNVDYGFNLDNMDPGEKGVISVCIDPILLTPGVYVIDAEIIGEFQGIALAERHSGWFQIQGTSAGHEGVFIPHVSMIKVEKSERSLNQKITLLNISLRNRT